MVCCVWANTASVLLLSKRKSSEPIPMAGSITVLFRLPWSWRKKLDESNLFDFKYEASTVSVPNGELVLSMQNSPSLSR